MKFTIIIFFLILLSFSNSVSGQAAEKKKKTKKASPTSTETVAKKPVTLAQKHKFSAMKLRGQLMRPELKLHEDGTGLREDTLPEIPADFDSESIKDVE